MNDKPKFQVLTAGVKKSSTSVSSHRSKTTKQQPLPQQPTKSVLSPDIDEHSNVNVMKPLMSQNHPSKGSNSNEGGGELEYEVPLDDDDDEIVEDVALNDRNKNNNNNNNGNGRYSDNRKVTFASQLQHTSPLSSKVGGSNTSASSSTSGSGGASDLVWLIICFIGIMASFVCYGLLLEYTTSGGRKLHELSFLFITSGLYTITAAAGRYVRDETPTTIPPRQFALLGLTSMGSTWCSVRSLRYVLIIDIVYVTPKRIYFA